MKDASNQHHTTLVFKEDIDLDVGRFEWDLVRH